MNRNILGAALALAGASTAFAAAPQSFYVTGAVGSTQTNLDCDGATHCDRNTMGVNVIGGWKFLPALPGLAAEASLAYLGQSKLHYTDESLGPIDAKGRAGYLGLGLAYHHDFGNDWSGIVRTGAALVRTRIEVDSQSGSGSQSHNKVRPYLGLGVAYALTRQVGLELDWSHTQLSLPDGTSTGYQINASTFSFGASYHF